MFTVPISKGGAVREISARPTLLIATIFTLALADCDGASAAVDAAHTKLAQPAKAADVEGTIRRKTRNVASAKKVSRAAKARSSVVKARSRHGRQLAATQTRKVHPVTHPLAARGKKLARLEPKAKPSKSQTRTLGLASFYSEDKETASGESFNERDLTAAHPTLPFGTRLRVTNVANGRVVTVRVNDRGPFRDGRIIDVSSAAAEALGMVNDGVVKVALDVVR
jgi:rare lipoprotein A